jgi:hypothetical protein
MGCKTSIFRVVDEAGFEEFEIGNGVLGLERDVYLSIVKFLDSSILRKV